MSDGNSTRQPARQRTFRGKIAIVESDGAQWEAAQNMTPAEIAVTVKLWREKWGLDVRSA